MYYLEVLLVLLAVRSRAKDVSLTACVPVYLCASMYQTIMAVTIVAKQNL